MTRAVAEAAGAADGEIDVRKARTAGHGPCTGGEIVVFDILEGWTIDRALFTGRRKIRRGHKWERVDACEIRERSTEGDRGKTEAKSVAHVVDRDGHGLGRPFGMRTWG
jgi:hypothetical protein